MERLYLETSKGGISYLERKGTHPVVFLHGLGGAGNNWLKLSKFLPDKYRLLMPDLAGHGKSIRDMQEYCVREETEFLESFIESLELKDYTLVGNSYGGWVAMKYSATIEQPQSLILVDSAGINPTVGESTQEDVERFVDRVMRMNPKNDRDTVRRFVSRNAKGDEKITDEELSRLPANTLIIWGRKDRLIPLEYAEKLHSSISGSSLKVIEEGGHIPHSTNPEEVAEAILNFLERR